MITVYEVLASATRTLRSLLELQALQGQFIRLPAGRVRLELAFVEDDTGGYSSVKVFSENADKNWDLLADLHFALGIDADNLYGEILEAIS